MKNTMKRIGRGLTAAALLLMMTAVICVPASAETYEGIGRCAVSNDGQNVTVTFELAESASYIHGMGLLSLQYRDGSVKTYNVFVKSGEGKCEVREGWSEIDHITGVVEHEPAHRGVLTIPVSYLEKNGVTALVFNDVSFSAEEMGLAKPAPAATMPPYTGIRIDGDFNDWAGVPERYRSRINDGRGYSTVDEVAMVWDGDWVYLFFHATGTLVDYKEATGNWNSVGNAGSHGNGQYAITTDLGRILLIQPAVRDGVPVIDGVDDAQVKVNNNAWFEAPHMWEAAIPASALPKYIETISFGLYQFEPVIENIADMEGGGSGGSFSGASYDGDYDDWDYYPVTLIHYAGPGTQRHVVDGTGSLWTDVDNGIILGHTFTEMPDHVKDDSARCMTDDVVIRVNGKGGAWDQDTDLMLQYLDMQTLEVKNSTSADQGNGRKEYFISTVHRTEGFGEKETANVDGFMNSDWYLGRAYVTVCDDHIETEYWLDIEKLAKFFKNNRGIDLEPNDIRTIEAQFGRIGQEWLMTAGTPTGPWLGVGLCVAAVCAPCVVGLSRKRKQHA